MSKRPHYGYPCVTDPHDFIPDGESCSPEEIAAHRLACANWGKPEYQPNVGCFEERNADGTLVRHVLRTSWGIGTNLMPHCDGCDMPTLGDPLMACHECGGPEFCGDCWPKHERWHENND